MGVLCPCDAVGGNGIENGGVCREIGARVELGNGGGGSDLGRCGRREGSELGELAVVWRCGAGSLLK